MMTRARPSWVFRIALGLSLLASGACSSGAATDVGSASDLDRTDVEDVANAFVTAFLRSDFESLRDLVRPEQRAQLDELVETLSAVPPAANSVESVRPQAVIIRQEDDRALVEYGGRYCLDEAIIEVPTTVLGDAGTTASDTVSTVVVPERCFDIAAVFPGGPAEYRLVGGRWFAPLPE